MDNADAAVMLVVSGMDARECARRRDREHANDDRDERDETTGLRHVHLDPLASAAPALELPSRAILAWRLRVFRDGADVYAWGCPAAPAQLGES
jgi:hypothetical protein